MSEYQSLAHVAQLVFQLNGYPLEVKVIPEDRRPSRILSPNQIHRAELIANRLANGASTSNTEQGGNRTSGKLCYRCQAQESSPEDAVNAESACALTPDSAVDPRLVQPAKVPGASAQGRSPAPGLLIDLPREPLPRSQLEGLLGGTETHEDLEASDSSLFMEDVDLRDISFAESISQGLMSTSTSVEIDWDEFYADFLRVVNDDSASTIDKDASVGRGKPCCPLLALEPFC